MSQPIPDKAEIALEYPDIAHREQLTDAVAQLHAALTRS
jgi:hypothetical protein